MAACPWARLRGFTRLSLKSKNEQILCTSISTDRQWGKHMENSSRKSHWRKIKCISYSQQVSDWKLIQAPKRHPDAEAKHGRLWYCTAASWLQFQCPPSGKGWAIIKSSRGQVSFTISFFPKQPAHYCSSNPNSTIRINIVLATQFLDKVSILDGDVWVEISEQFNFVPGYYSFAVSTMRQIKWF